MEKVVRYALAKSPWGYQYITRLFSLYGIVAVAMFYARPDGRNVIPMYIIAVRFDNVSSNRINWAELLWVKLCINMRWMPFGIANKQNIAQARRNPQMPVPGGRRKEKAEFFDNV